MTVVVSDSFNRADNAASLGSADTGQAWTAITGTWGIASNQAKGPSSGNALAAIESGTSDCTIQVTFATASANVGVAFRIVDGNNYLLVYRDNGGVTLRRVVAGSASNTLLAGATPTSGDVIKIVLSGTSVSVFVNGVQYGTTQTVTNFQTATMHGLGWAAPSPSSRWDDFSISTAAAGGVNASAIGTLALSGSASAAALVEATASGALSLSVSATASVAIAATAAGALQLAGSATAAVLVHATAAGALALSGSATVGTPAIHATASGALSLSGSAAAAVLDTVRTTGTLALSGTANAAVLDRASVSGTLSLAGTARVGVLITAQAAGALLLTGRATLLHPGLVLPLSTLKFGALVVLPPGVQLGALVAPKPAVSLGAPQRLPPSVTLGPPTLS